jgi:perosamine synthetase
MGPIAAFAKARNVYVIEDCAEAHGARYDGRSLGCYSDIACFSFYANKIVTTGEGGMCLTDSPQLAEKLMQLRDHGASPNSSYWHERVGYNYRMTNLQAAIGLNQLWRIDRTLARNRALDRLYREHLSGIRGVTFPPPLPNGYEPVVWLVSAQVPADARTRLIDAARAHDVEMRPFFHSISEMPIYEKFARPCPNSTALARSGINLPTSNGVDIGVIEKVAGVFRKVFCG